MRGNNAKYAWWSVVSSLEHAVLQPRARARRPTTHIFIQAFYRRHVRASITLITNCHESPMELSTNALLIFFSFSSLSLFLSHSCMSPRACRLIIIEYTEKYVVFFSFFLCVCVCISCKNSCSRGKILIARPTDSVRSEPRVGT